MNTLLISATLPAIAATWQLDKILSGALLSVGYVGMFLGALGFGLYADRIGRKPTLIITITIAAIFTGLCSIAVDPISTATLRFLAGIGLGGSLPLPGVYISEYVPASHRGKFLGLVETSWVYGVLLAIIFPFFLIPAIGWRLTFLVGFIPLLLVPFIMRFTPESVRYLELKDRTLEAIGPLQKNKVITEQITFAPSSKTSEKISLFKTLRSLWSTGFRSRTLILWVSWAVLVYTYHGIFQWLPSMYVEILKARELMGPLTWVIIITLVQIPGYYSATFLLDHLGRKKVLATYLAVAGIGSLMISISKGFGAILLWSGIVSFFNLGAWAALYAYSPELYPTRIRGTGVGSAASIGRLAGTVAPYLTGYVWAVSGLTSAFIVFTALHLFAAITVGSIGIETKKKVLETIAK